MRLCSFLVFLTHLSFARSQNEDHPCRPGANDDGSTPKFKSDFTFKSITKKDGLQLGETTACVNNTAAGYPCKNIDLLSHLSLSEFNEPNAANDIWGWFDEENNKEYAILGLYSGTAFVDVTDPESPEIVGVLPAYRRGSSWRDIKTYKNHAYIVSEASVSGLQVYDMTQLESVTNRPNFNLEETAHLGIFGQAHNIFINEDSARAYVVGARSNYNGGLYVIDISDPKSPNAFRTGGYAYDGYTHDVQCVIYDGPDSRYSGKEICFACNEDTLTIIDMTDARSPKKISKLCYDANRYTHQGWLTEDSKYFLIDDELDERYGCSSRTNTRIVDVSDLQEPRMHASHLGTTRAIDHNQYVHGGYVYQANYYSGLRILDLASIDDGTLTEVAYFDVEPRTDIADFGGAWSVYPFLPSGNIIVSSIESGLFVLHATDLANSTNTSVSVESLYAETGNVEKSTPSTMDISVQISDQDGYLMSESLVYGIVNNDVDNILSCVTDEMGACVITHELTTNDEITDLISFEIKGVEKPGYHYDSKLNRHDPFTNGRTITLNWKTNEVIPKSDAKLNKIFNDLKKNFKVHTSVAMPVES